MIPKDLPNKSIGEQTESTPNLDFLEKKEGTLADTEANNFPITTESDNLDAEGNALSKEELNQIENESLQEKEDRTLYAANFFKLPKKKTMTDVPYGTTKNERLDKQKEILNKIEGDVEIDQSTGSIILKEFEEGEVKYVDDLLEKFNLGTLTEAKKNTSTKFIFKELDTDANGVYSPGAFSDLVFKMFGDKIQKAKGGKISVDTVLSQAAELGRSDVYLKVFNKKPGEALPLAYSVRALVETKLLYTQLRKIAEKGATGAATEADKVEFYKVLRLYGHMLSQSAADISEGARKMRMTQEITKVNPELGISIEGAKSVTDWLSKNMNADFSAEGFQQISSHFLMLRPDQASKFAKQSLASKWVDGWVEIWVNSRLMSPITHIVNTVGNIGFNSLRLFEYTTAAALNKVPFLGSPDGVQFNEVMSMIKALKYGTRLGLDNAVEGFKQGAPTTKLDLPPRNSIGKQLAGKYEDTFLGTMFEYIGTAARVPGRLLVAEDEFMKGILFQVELERIATQRMNQAINNGLSKTDAEQIYIKTISDPDVSVINDVKASMLEGTFQQDLPPGVFKNIQGFMNEPAIKMFVPFYKTVTNIFLESSKRNPFLAGLMPSVRRDLSGANGPAKRQLAASKIITGAGLMYTFGNFAYGAADGSSNYIITGRAPGNKKERDAFFRNGYQAYSIGIRQDDGNFKFFSYARFEPISTFLAMAADMGYAMSRPDQYGYEQDENYQALFSAGTTWLYNYMGEQPFVSGIADISKAFNGLGGDDETKFINGMSAIVGQVMDATYGVAVNPTGTFSNYLIRMQDPKIYDTMISPDQADAGIFGLGAREDGGDIPLLVREFYKNLNKIHRQSPFFNPDLKPALNLWGEEMVGPEQGIINPIKILHKQGYNQVDDWLQTHGLGMSMPSKKFKRYIAMDGEQYHTLITLMNKEYNGKTMLSEMQEKMNSTTWLKYQNAPGGPLLGKQLDMLEGVKQKYIEKANKELVLLYPQLETAIMNIDAKIERTGSK